MNPNTTGFVFCEAFKNAILSSNSLDNGIEIICVFFEQNDDTCMYINMLLTDQYYKYMYSFSINENMEITSITNKINNIFKQSFVVRTTTVNTLKQLNIKEFSYRSLDQETLDICFTYNNEGYYVSYHPEECKYGQINSKSDELFEPKSIESLIEELQRYFQ